MKNFLKLVLKCINLFLNLLNFKLVRNIDLLDYSLHKYNSHDEYKAVQIKHNKLKLNHIWADKKILKFIANSVINDFQEKSKILGICHGSRNGFEQNFLNTFNNKLDVIGTDISDSVLDFENSILWDFHDVNPDWSQKFDFIYSNSIDQSWKPSLALTTWLNQIHDKGYVFIELSKFHGPQYSGSMDPFGVKPKYFPYVLSSWYGSQITFEFELIFKENKKIPAWVFKISKNVSIIENLDTLN